MNMYFTDADVVCNSNTEHAQATQRQKFRQTETNLKSNIVRQSTGNRANARGGRPSATTPSFSVVCAGAKKPKSRLYCVCVCVCVWLPSRVPSLINHSKHFSMPSVAHSSSTFLTYVRMSSRKTANHPWFHDLILVRTQNKSIVFTRFFHILTDIIWFSVCWFVATWTFLLSHALLFSANDWDYATAILTKYTRPNWLL